LREQQGRVLLGEGALNWSPRERQDDRYGYVHLSRNPDRRAPTARPPADYVAFEGAPRGEVGRLWAEVVEPRDSYHVGDLFRNIYPSKRAAGDWLLLGGPGYLDVRLLPKDGTPTVGLIPLAPKEADWLDPRALYQVHTSVVRLWFEPADQGAPAPAGESKEKVPA
jgi:hypothetical protein